MKIRYWITAGLWIITLGSFSVWTAPPPKRSAHPNFDKRSGGVAVAPDANEQAAEATLGSRVDGLKISRDTILGTPRMVSASRGFLTDAGGKGKALSTLPGLLVADTDPHAPIKNFLNEYSALFGHNAGVLTDARIRREYVTAHNGLQTVIWDQSLDDIPVVDGVLAAHVTRNGELVSISSMFVPDVRAAANAGTPGRAALISSPTISAAESVARAAANLGVELDGATVLPTEESAGAERRQKFKAGLLRGEALTRLVWLPMNRSSLRLCWRVELSTRSAPELYSLFVDAETGEVLVRRCLTNYLTDATYNVFTQESPAPMLPGLSVPGTTQAPIVPRQLVTLSALDTNASPSGWISDGDTDTQGNNVDAHTDLNDDDGPDLPRPTDANRVFNFPLNLTQAPISYANASVVQLFYWCNWYHDKLYDLGFTEAAGNFQNNNFGRGGAGNDAVQADAQDGGGTDNANFSTPPDGQPGRMQMYIFSFPTPNRDGALDGTVVLHEHTHGLSNRLVGGGTGIFLLQTEGMGEGWSDFYGLALLAPVDADPHAVYPGGAYLTYQFFGLTENYYYGIRRYPYSTDLNKNPLTFKDIDPSQADPHAGIPTSPIAGGGPADEVHNQGEVWCVTLWEARANLVDKLGGDEGNTTILQLVTDGMKLSPPNPTFLEARDAIILADQVNSGGDNYSELWLAFAKRGMGFSAGAPASDTTVGVEEAFDLPPDVVPSVPDGILEITVNPRAGSVLFASDNQPIFVRVADGPSVTNAVIVATSTGGAVLNFRNDGVAPDKTPDNGTYSALFTVPTNTSSVTITMVISAQDKETATNVVTYIVIPLPLNDNLANGIKVPVAGASYVSNNRFATLETGEPVHAGLFRAAASLWWIWSAPTTTNVLVDTGGSLVDTIAAVYTGTQVNALTQVAAVNDVGVRRQAYLTFTAQAGIAYKIAVASANTNNTGSLRLRIAPGGSPDTSPPVVSITSPSSGFVTSTNRLVLSGTAVDPEPNPSGIDRISINITASLDPTAATEIVVTNRAAANASNSTNWFQLIGLAEGVNEIRVTATDLTGNVSAPAFIQVFYRPRDPVNDLFRNAIALAGADDVSSVNTLEATKEPGEPLHAGNNGGRSAWWTFTPTSDGVLTLSTTNSLFDTLLGLYTTNTPTTGPVPLSSLVAIASNDDAYDGVNFSKISQAVRANHMYWIAVDGFDGASGLVYLTHNFAVSNVFQVIVSAVGSGNVSPGSGEYVGGSTVVFTPVAYGNSEFVDWAVDGTTSSANPLSVVVNGPMTITARFRDHEFSDGFDSGAFSSALSWSNDPNHPWVIESTNVSAGAYAARSGVISDGQTSTLQLTIVSGNGVASFDYRVSSESNWDWLEFYLNGVPGVSTPVQRWSGEVGWTTYQFAVPAGTNTLAWRYVKDTTISIGADAAFIDSLFIPPVPPSVPPLAQPSLRLLNPTAGAFQIRMSGKAKQSVRIQGSTDLSSWQDISTVVLSSGAVFQFGDPQAPNFPVYRFYRVVAP